MHFNNVITFFWVYWFLIKVFVVINYFYYIELGKYKFETKLALCCYVLHLCLTAYTPNPHPLVRIGWNNVIQTLCFLLMEKRQGHICSCTNFGSKQLQLCTFCSFCSLVKSLSVQSFCRMYIKDILMKLWRVFWRREKEMLQRLTKWFDKNFFWNKSPFNKWIIICAGLWINDLLIMWYFSWLIVWSGECKMTLTIC